jgi:ABC-type sugar transport system, periplasmic component
MMRKTLFRAISFLIAAGLLLTQMAACGGDGKNVPEKTTLRIMSWNEDFRDMMEKYFIPRHEKLMKNVEIEWIITEINSYRSDLQNRLSAGERIDIFLGNSEMAPFLAADPHIAPLADLGITEEELSGQYRFTRVLGSDQSGVQKGAAFDAEPGILLYRADYAEEYLGVTHQEEMQEKLSSWESFLTVAQTLSEKTGGKIKMLPNSAELWKSVDCAMTGLWLTDGRLSVSDDTVSHWLDTVKNLYSVDGFANARTLDDDWYSAIDGGVFCFYASPWLCRSGRSETADITTVFSYARRSGVSFGKFKTSLAPEGFIYGGNWLYSSQNPVNREIAAEIIRSFTCDRQFMKQIALAEVRYVNNAEVCAELGQMKMPNPLFDGLDIFSVYHSAALGLEIAPRTIYDSSLSELLFAQTKAYCKGDIRLKEAVYKFRLSVWKRHEEITDEPEKP